MNMNYCKSWCQIARNVFEFKNMDFKVTHNRMFNFVAVSPMSKSKFEKERRQFPVFCGKISEYISNNGGYTNISLVMDGQEYKSKFNFSKKEVFCRPYSTMICLKKILSKTENGRKILNYINYTMKLPNPAFTYTKSEAIYNRWETGNA